MLALAHYLHKFSRLRTDRTGGWTATTQGQAPHKPILLLSGELRITQNVPGHLLTLESRSIIGPAEPALWPHLEALEWHRQNVFRRG